jgi:tetratricopeptide (TPR) repeat protein
MPPLQPIPSRKASCLCGSGKRFKRCCADYYKGRRPGRSSYDAINRGDFAAALRECRADITQYTIWHKSHTEPAVRDGFADISWLLDTDIRAMGELVNLLLICYQQLDIVGDFPEVLERLRTNINDERWQRKITYFHALCALWPDWDKHAGQRELKRLGSVESETDPEILQLYIELFGNELSFSKKIVLIDRVIETSDKNVDILHYRGLRAVQYLLIGDNVEAEQTLASAIAAFRENSSKELTLYEKFRFAMTEQLLWEFRKDDLLIDEALTLYQEVIDADDWPAEGKADAHKLIGDIYRHQGDWSSALNAYGQSFQLVPAPICEVFSSECLIRLNKLTEASEKLLAIDTKRLDASEYADYVFAFAVVAIEDNKLGLCERAEQQLRVLELKDPYFRERRDKLILEVIEARHKKPSRAVVERVRGVLNAVMKKTIKYLIVQPNFMGLGVDLGKIAEDLTSSSKQHEERARDHNVKRDSV